MGPIYLFIILLIALTIGLGIILGSSSRIDVMTHWGERRCDLDVLLSAFMYKPDDDSRSTAQFTTDNFQYCIGSKTNDYLESIFGVLYEVLRKQMGAADIMTSVMKVLRIQLNTIYAPFSKMMNNFWNKFREIGGLSSRIFQHLYMSMKKAAATSVASLYVAISLQTAILNGIDLVINIIMIVLYILLALAFIFFIPILPVMAFVIMAVSGIESAFPGRTGGMGDVYCFDKNTQIAMAGFTSKPISEIKIGDILRNRQTVEAVVELPGSFSGLFHINGVLVSGDHRIWLPQLELWVLAREHPEAVPTDYTPRRLWTLITSNRQIPVINNKKEILQFADWEELPDTYEAAALWDTIVRSILMSKDIRSSVPVHAPCFDPTIRVEKYQKGWVPMSEIQCGDWIRGHVRWTQVVGICTRRVKGGIGEKGDRMTDGVWFRDGMIWVHPRGPDTRGPDTTEWDGLHFITDSGTFRIRTHKKELCVRDFTEVGWSKLPETYTRVEMAMTTLEKK